MIKRNPEAKMYRARITPADRLMVAYPQPYRDSRAHHAFRAACLVNVRCKEAGVDLSRPHRVYADSNGDYVYEQEDVIL